MMPPTPQRYHQNARTWYGLPVEVTVSSADFHRVSVPGLTLPHPGVVNWFVRRGLPPDIRLELTARHELGHLQTLLVPLCHLAWLLWPRRGRPPGLRGLRWLVGLLTHQALWEVAAEAYTALGDRRAFRAQRQRRFRLGYGLFWLGMAGAAWWGTRFLTRREEG